MRHLPKTLSALFLLTLLVACAEDPEPAPPAQAAVDEDAEFQAYCEETGQCEMGKQDGSFSSELWSFMKGSLGIVFAEEQANAQEAFFEDPGHCPKADQMSHFVDLAEEVDGVPLFTSVQDFTIEREGIAPEDVAAIFREDWLTWWKGGTTAPGSVGAIDGSDDFGIEIRPLGISAVSIKMSVGPVEANPPHPPLESPDLDEVWKGYEQTWDAGVTIEMDRGNAFVGTMYILVREIEGGLHVREMWYRTEPVAPLVMKFLPVGLFIKDDTSNVEARLRVSAFLHLAATQGCAAPQGTGYPGLIDALESGALP